IISINGGLGLIKVFLLRFFKIRFFSSIRFPLHDQVRHNHGWSPTQVLIRFVILQILISIALLGIFFKVR
ncbi:MAG: phospho-N-acetylmuramoyl-pentapeptide-transferase, partial [Spirochaetaceae bacterium]|nr:phospho-N-acetylmuramoyl-pentapeptide-transferase [Spirochaetaceae bacterium]